MLGTRPNASIGSGAHPGKLIFANQLRGVAALLVAASHLFGVFWALRDYVAVATFSPVQSGGVPAIYRLISYRWFEFGPFGVALFFLISGMVIPFSLQTHSRWSFFLARLLRIYPTFIIAMLLEMSLLYAASRYWHHPFTYSPKVIVANCLLINDLTGYPVIDFVNWTLAIEMKFYLLVLVAAVAFRHGGVLTLFAIAAAILLLDVIVGRHIVGIAAGPISPLLSTVSLESPYLIFMLIGTLFHFHIEKKYGALRLAGLVMAMTGLFLLSWRSGIQSVEYPVVTFNYLLAILVFAVLYTGRRYIRNSRFLDFMAAISFPFYLIHAVLGFTIMKYLIVAVQLNYYVALVFAVLTVIAVSYLIHRTIEVTTIQMGRNLANQGNARTG